MLFKAIILKFLVNNIFYRNLTIKTWLKQSKYSISISNLMAPYLYRKKDFSTAIMDRKKAPHKLQVEDSKLDDNSVVEMTQAKMDELKIFKGDTVILKGKCDSQFG